MVLEWCSNGVRMMLEVLEWRYKGMRML
jgi:hypothetical protein